MGHKPWQKKKQGKGGSVIGYGGPRNNPPARRFAPHEFAQEVLLFGGPPRVLLSRQAYDDMFCLVDIVADEVGWLGTVERVGRDFLIKEIFLPKQEAHVATCELTPEGLSELATELISTRPDGVEVANSLRFWGHSHHLMETNPSGQDVDQFYELAHDCGDFFIRGILNKRGRMEFCIYLVPQGILIKDAEWSLEEEVDDALRRRWEVEVKAKVSDLYEEPEIEVNESGGVVSSNVQISVATS